MNETTQPAVAGPIEPTVMHSTLAAFVEALHGMRGDLADWLKCNDEADVRAHVLALVRAEREAAARVRTKAPRELRQVGAGAILGEQQFCFAKGWKEGQAELRRAIRGLGGRAPKPGARSVRPNAQANLTDTAR